MSDILSLRTALRAAEGALDVARARLDELSAELDDPDLPPASQVSLRKMVAAQGRIVGARTIARDAALNAYRAAVQSDPVHAVDAGLPLVLLPVRIEAAYLPVPSGLELCVRVYPDDIHVDAHEPALTPAELAASTAYWRAIWGAGANSVRLDAAWNLLLGQLKPARASWAVHVLTPQASRPAMETPADQRQPEPPLPSAVTTTAPFTRGPRTALLPHHWYVIGVRKGQEAFWAEGSAIPDTLDVSFGPAGTDANGSPGLPFGERSRWLVDLDAALAVGMAIRIPLADPQVPIDQLFVFGIKSQTAPEDAAQLVASALIAHQYTRGLGFLAHGTPTNNTSAQRSGWESASRVPSHRQVEEARSRYLPSSQQNAALVARILGDSAALALNGVDHALDDQQTAVFVLQRQLWNALQGKALSLLYWRWDIPNGESPSQGGWNLHDSPDVTAMLKEHVLGWVRSRGSLPVLRVGNQPYGFLPASSLAGWATAAGDPTAPLVGWLRDFWPYFRAAVATVPRVAVGAEQDPDVAVANVLMQLPVSPEIRVRADGDAVEQAVSNRPLPVAPIPGLPPTSGLFFAAPAKEAAPLPMALVGNAGADQKLLIRALTLFEDSIKVLAGDDPSMDHAKWIAEYAPLIGASGFPDAPPPDVFTMLVWDSFTDPLAAPADELVAGLLFGALAFDKGKDDPAFQQRLQQFLPRARAFVAEFAELCALNPDDYDPILRELLDVASHRFDAWVCSLYARRLEQMRTVKPTGIVLGAYGWVEGFAPGDLTPDPNPPPGFAPAFVSPRQTHVHAPSLHHAATAAVLRAGYDSHPHPEALAVNLESRRVRVADWLAEGVRNGQTVGALLGYRFERGLHELNLDSLIEGLRLLWPLPLPTGPDTDEHGAAAREVVAARSVVDGLALVRQRESVLKAVPSARDAVGQLLDELEDAFDALGDLLLAESVHHLVGGNPLRAGLSADSVGRGEPLPERFDVVHTPRSGHPVTWQIGALLPAAWSGAATGWRNDRPRAQIEPHVNAWVSSLLGNAEQWQIGCTVTTADGSQSSVPIGLERLGLCPLDIIVDSSGELSSLERRIIDSIARPLGGTVRVIREPARDGALGWPELVALAERIRSLLARASALGPRHVQAQDASPVLGLDVDELGARVELLRNGLAAVLEKLRAAMDADTAVAMHSALLQAADLGVTAAYPVSADGDATALDRLRLQATSLFAQLQPMAATPTPSPPGPGANSIALETWVRAVSEYVRAILGRSVPVLACFLLPSNSTYAASFAASAAPTGADRPACMTWLRRLARVRPDAAALFDLLLASESLAGTLPEITAAQLPPEVGARWLGLPFGTTAPPRARLGTLVATPQRIDTTQAFTGLLFDTWTEQVPGLTRVVDPTKGYEPSEVTGVAFTVDAPDAYAPQAVLLAVAPDPSAGWSPDVLFDVLQETLDLAKTRCVDLGDLPRLGRVLPGIHAGSNLDAALRAVGVS